MNPYEVLGVDRGATKDEVKRAYKKRAQQVHPDRGGKTEAFQALTAAYRLLSNDSKRARYDASGDQSGVDNRMGEVLNFLANSMLNVIEGSNGQCDVVAEVRAIVMHEVEKVKGSRAQNEQRIARLARARQRLRHKKGGGEHMLGALLDGQISAWKAQCHAMDDADERYKTCLEILAEYSYDVGQHSQRSAEGDFAMMLQGIGRRHR